METTTTPSAIEIPDQGAVVSWSLMFKRVDCTMALKPKLASSPIVLPKPASRINSDKHALMIKELFAPRHRYKEKFCERRVKDVQALRPVLIRAPINNMMLNERTMSTAVVINRLTSVVNS